MLEIIPQEGHEDQKPMRLITCNTTDFSTNRRPFFRFLRDALWNVVAWSRLGMSRGGELGLDTGWTQLNRPSHLWWNSTIKKAKILRNSFFLIEAWIRKLHTVCAPVQIAAFVPRNAKAALGRSTPNISLSIINGVKSAYILICKLSPPEPTASRIGFNHILFGA